MGVTLRANRDQFVSMNGVREAASLSMNKPLTTKTKPVFEFRQQCLGTATKGNKDIREMYVAIVEDLGCEEAELFQKGPGGYVWCHADVALIYAQHLSKRFYVRCNRIVQKFLSFDRTLLDDFDQQGEHVTGGVVTIDMAVSTSSRLAEVVEELKVKLKRESEELESVILDKTQKLKRENVQMLHEQAELRATIHEIECVNAVTATNHDGTQVIRTTSDGVPYAFDEADIIELVRETRELEEAISHRLHEKSQICEERQEYAEREVGLG
jgi:hypothetical protein